MNATELRTTFRSEFFDMEEPYLVSDALIYTYLDEAQKMFCRLTEGIEDGRKFAITLAPGTEWYALSRAILKLRKVTDAMGRKVDVISQEASEQAGIRFDGRTGPVKALVSGIEKGKLRAWPVPAEAGTLRLDVFRLPATVEAGGDLEIDEQHHLPLLLWVKHKAYGIHDTETYDKTKSEDYEFRFRNYCSAAKAEQGRARHDAGTVTYGGY